MSGFAGEMSMKIISWNLNGLMPCLENGSLLPLSALDADVFCFQETRTAEQPTIFPNYHHFWLNGRNPGYAGVSTLTRQEPRSVRYGIGNPELDREGRLLTLEFANFWSVNAYFPKSQGKLARHAYRMEWDAALLEWLTNLCPKKPKLPDILREDGYPDVQAFMATYREAEAVVEQYNRDLAEWEHQVKQKSRPPKPPERESVRSRLRQLQEQGRQQKPRKKSFDRDSR